MTSSMLKGVLTMSVRTIDDLTPQLQAKGWRVGIVSGAATRSEALDALGRALDFPSYYGRNLDALTDCLRDVDRPTALLWAGWEPLAVNDADGWAAVLSVLKERVADRDVAFSVVFCSAAPSEN